MPQRFAPLLVRAPAPTIPVRHGHAERIIDHDGGLLRVLGGPGTGKTALAVELAVDRILRRAADPENVLVLTANRRAAATVRAAISARLAGSGFRVARGPLVRTVHSYAFGVLRLRAALTGRANGHSR